MPTTIETTVCSFSELSASAKQKAIDANRDWNTESDWHECVQEDFETIGKILGIEFDTRPAKLMGGGTRFEPKIWFSGFSSQGDSACFEGTWRYSKGMAKGIRAHAPNDTELHSIADSLADIQKRYFYGIGTRITHMGRYYHEHTMRFDHFHSSDCELPSAVTDEIEQQLKALARWYYAQLESSYNYLCSDEAIAESLEANDVQFLVNGNKA